MWLNTSIPSKSPIDVTFNRSFVSSPPPEDPLAIPALQPYEVAMPQGPRSGTDPTVVANQMFMVEFIVESIKADPGRVPGLISDLLNSLTAKQFTQLMARVQDALKQLGLKAVAPIDEIVTPPVVMTDEEIEAMAQAEMNMGPAPNPGAGWGGSSFTNEGGIATIDSSGKISWSGWGGIPNGGKSLFSGREDNATAPPATPPEEGSGLTGGEEAF